MRVIAILMCLLSMPINFNAQELSAEQIMSLAFEKLLEDEKLKAEKLIYQKRYKEEELQYKDGRIVVKTRNGRPEKYEELYDVYTEKGKWIEKLIEKNGRPPSPKDTEIKIADKKPLIEDILSTLRYNYKNNGLSTFQGKEVHSISLEPKHPSLQPKLEPGASIKAQVENETLNNLTGIIYVNTANYSILRVEVHLMNRLPLRIKTGKLYILDSTVIREELLGIAVNTTVEVTIKGAYVSLILFDVGNEFKKITTTYENYRLK